MKKRAAVLVLIVLITAACFLIFIKASEKEKKPYLDAALEAAQWIRASAVHTEDGTTWLAIPENEKSIGNILYNGTPGVILFFLEMHYATGDKTFLDDARAGADYMLATLDKERGEGFYVGISGIGFALEETYKATKDEQYRKGVEKCIHYLKENAVKKKTGVEWSTTSDIISGSAGAGLFLIYAAKELKDASLLDLAVQAGQRLIDLGQSEKGGTKWAADIERPLLMPNFSHGTAGISYFLASLYAETEQKEFLDSALSGARYLQSVAQTEGDTCLIFHDEPDGKDLYYLGWCHGPTGTAQLFYRLYQVTGDEGWMEWVEKCARAILQSGIPEKQTPGFWNNVGQCCGSAGVAEFFLNLYRIKQKKEYLDFARHLTSDLLKRGTHDEAGLKWIHGEYRRRPEFLQAQTGLMQGAAGIGLWLLHLDYFDRAKNPRIVLPDSPY